MPRSENSNSVMFWYAKPHESDSYDELYKGYTNDLNARLEKHNSGEVKSTKPYRPWELIHYEAYKNKEDTKRRESYLKTSAGRRAIKRMLKEYFYNKRR